MSQKPKPTLSDFSRSFFTQIFPALPQKAICVEIASQSLVFFHNAISKKIYSVSTAKAGSGNQSGSHQTPLGRHIIAKKIGKKIPLYGRLIARCYTGEQVMPLPEGKNTEEDIITSRILWLKGTEPGINTGGPVDSFLRYIYIHGTCEEHRIGEPISHGCIRMKNEEVVELFDEVEIGTPVSIHKKF